MRAISLFLVGLSVIYHTPLLAREGLQFLNAFPQNEQFFAAELSAEQLDIEVDDLGQDDYSNLDHAFAASALYGKKLSSRTWATAKLSWIYNEENSLRYGSASSKNYIFRGFREPEFAWNKRLSHRKSDGDYFTDLKLAVLPGLFERKAGENQANGWSGSTVAKARLSTGALYDFYEARICGEYEYYSWSKGENLDLDKSYTSASYYTLGAFLDLQRMPGGNWIYFLSSGITFTSDYDVKVDGDATTIQQGTASIGKLGAKYLTGKSFWTLVYGYQRNDYFTESRERGNFRGDFTGQSLFMSWTSGL